MLCSDLSPRRIAARKAGGSTRLSFCVCVTKWDAAHMSRSTVKEQVRQSGTVLAPRRVQSWVRNSSNEDIES